MEQAREKRGRQPAPTNKSYDYSFVKTCKVLNISTEVFGRALKLYKSQKEGNSKLFELMKQYKLHLEDRDLEDRVGFVQRVFEYYNGVCHKQRTTNEKNDGSDENVQFVPSTWYEKVQFQFTRNLKRSELDLRTANLKQIVAAMIEEVCMIAFSQCS